jgi:hypothetical protein
MERVGGIFYFYPWWQLEFIMRKPDLSDSDFKIENVELAFNSNCSLNTFENLLIYKLISLKVIRDGFPFTKNFCFTFWRNLERFLQ